MVARSRRHEIELSEFEGESLEKLKKQAEENLKEKRENLEQARQEYAEAERHMRQVSAIKALSDSPHASVHIQGD